MTAERAVLAEALSVACKLMGLQHGALTYATFGDSVGAPVRDGRCVRWLRVYPAWPAEYPRERAGWETATMPGVSKPKWHGCEHFEHDGRTMRADLLSLAPSPTCASELILTAIPPVTDQWFADMRRTVDALAAWKTDRVSITNRMAAKATVWVTGHADMHWCNLTAPEFCLLDWDSWGKVPLGFDAATAYCAALLVPDVAAQVYRTFRDQLETDTGRLSIWLAANHLSRIIDSEGRYHEIEAPLRELQNSLSLHQ
jgi:hypothetical protein